MRRATTLMFEGIPTWPDTGRFWDIVDKHKVNIYTAPAIRSLMSYGLDPLRQRFKQFGSAWLSKLNPSMKKHGIGTVPHIGRNRALSSIPGGRLRPVVS